MTKKEATWQLSFNLTLIEFRNRLSLLSLNVFPYCDNTYSKGYFRSDVKFLI